MKRLALINKDREDFQYNSRDLVYIILPLTSQLRTASRKVSIKYVGPLAVYKIVDPHNYLLITLDGKLLRGLFKHERLKPAVIRTNQGNVTNLSKLKQVMSYYHNEYDTTLNSAIMKIMMTRTNYVQLYKKSVIDGNDRNPDK